MFGKTEHNSIAHFVLDFFNELFFCILDPISIVTVDNVDQTVRTLLVVSPEGADLTLSSDVPHGETQVLLLTTSPSFSLQRIVVLPPASSPTIKIHISTVRVTDR